MGCTCTKYSKKDLSKEDDLQMNMVENMLDQNSSQSPSPKKSQDNSKLLSQNKNIIINNNNINISNNFSSSDPHPSLIDLDLLNKASLSQIINISSNSSSQNFFISKVFLIINKIRQDPIGYSSYILDNIKYIISNRTSQNSNKEIKNKIIYKRKIKVALTRGEPAFKEAAEILKGVTPLPHFEFAKDICIPTPQNEDELNDNNFIPEQIKKMKNGFRIDMYFKDLIKIPEVAALLMIVDDNGINAGKRRIAILNKGFKYIGISCNLIGKTFVAYYSFF